MFTKSSLFLFSGIGLICTSLVIFGLIFYPVISLEINYQLKKSHYKPWDYSSKLLSPVIENSGEFRIVIPKIDLSSKVLPNINPYKREDYLNALSRGVAQAKGSALPGESGNMFIFAHSTNSPFISYYNAAFYLLNKLTTGDEINISYQGKNYRYEVVNTKIVDPSQVNYLQNKSSDRILTLMTCWPAGTTLKRLLVTSRLIP